MKKNNTQIHQNFSKFRIKDIHWSNLHQFPYEKGVVQNITHVLQFYIYYLIKISCLFWYADISERLDWFRVKGLTGRWLIRSQERFHSRPDQRLSSIDEDRSARHVAGVITDQVDHCGSEVILRVEPSLQWHYMFSGPLGFVPSDRSWICIAQV